MCSDWYESSDNDTYTHWGSLNNAPWVVGGGMSDSWKTACGSNSNKFPGLPLTNDTDIMERWEMFDDVYANMSIEMVEWWRRTSAGPLEWKQKTNLPAKEDKKKKKTPGLQTSCLQFESINYG